MVCHVVCWYNNQGLALFIFLQIRLICVLVKSDCLSCETFFNEFWQHFLDFYFPIQVVSETHLWRQHYKVAPGSDSTLVGDFTLCTPEASDSALDYILWLSHQGKLQLFPGRAESNQQGAGLCSGWDRKQAGQHASDGCQHSEGLNM